MKIDMKLLLGPPLFQSPIRLYVVWFFGIYSNSFAGLIIFFFEKKKEKKDLDYEELEV